MALSSVLLLRVPALAQSAAAAPTKINTASKADYLERFAGTAKMRTKDGTPKVLHVTIHNWIIPNDTKVDPLPEEGYLIIQLRAGELVTVINGKREKRKTDEFWSVPAGSKMTLETERDSAIVQIVAIRDARQ